MKRIKEVIETLKSFDQETLEMIRYSIFGFIVIDLLFVFWFLELKKLAMALFLVSAVFLSVILILERRFDEEMPKKKKNNIKNPSKSIDQEINDVENQLKKKKLLKLKKKLLEDDQEKEESSQDEENNGFMGLPSGEEYNKRIEEAMGGGFFN